MRTMIAGCAVALLVLAVGAGAGIEHTILHGAKVGKVHVWVGPDTVPDLSQEQLQTSAESQLREAGIAIAPGAPATLLVSVRVFTRPDCFADVTSSLVEDALLERNGMRVQARSWETGGTIMQCPVSECVHNIPEAVERAVSDFIEIYSAMNPSAD
jgi:hypothetical protein